MGVAECVIEEGAIAPGGSPEPDRKGLEEMPCADEMG
jgi:hypothetical protein